MLTKDFKLVTRTALLIEHKDDEGFNLTDVKGNNLDSYAIGQILYVAVDSKGEKAASFYTVDQGWVSVDIEDGVISGISKH